MKILGIIIFASIALTVMGFGHEATKNVDVEADKVVITGIVDQWNKNALAGNYESNVQRYLEGALRIGPKGTLKGKAAIRADFNDFHEKNNLTECNNRVKDIKIAGDLAVVIGSFTGAYISRESGESTEMNSSWIAVYERQSDGSWRMSYSIGWDPVK